MSRVGHLSNDSMSDFLEHDLDASTAHLILGHLSEQNNHRCLVTQAGQQALEARGIGPSLEIASQHRPSEVYRF